MAHYNTFGDALAGGKALMANDDRIEDFHPVQHSNGKWVLMVLAKRMNISDLHDRVQEYQSKGFHKPDSGVPRYKRPPQAPKPPRRERHVAPPSAPPPPPRRPPVASAPPTPPPPPART